MNTITTILRNLAHKVQQSAEVREINGTHHATFNTDEQNELVEQATLELQAIKEDYNMMLKKVYLLRNTLSN